ncbi:hypothetical protein TCE0_047r17922 [Talaromyces pinophilus]|uniref:Uncharacterized protein n=1 Tax=Talaromyces pinophilus TaxID=128442 RepID=A0A0B8N511_TALPI|nr:hypothetical protein TCE0_047r17922 [Talaromyces pinophilus]
MARQIESAHKNGDKRFNLITTLNHLKDRSVTRLRETGNMRTCMPLPNLNASPPQANHFLSNQPCISPVDYDAPMKRVILYPQPSPVQAQLIKIFETWLGDATRALSTKSKKLYGTRQSSQWKLHGRWSGCNYFARLVLQEVDAFPSVVLETIHIERGKENDEHFERDYIYEKAARWFEGSPNGTMQLVIIALISHDPLLPWTSPSLPDWNPASPCHDWGMSPNQIKHSSAATIATNIATQDKNSSALTGVDLYLATASYPNHRGYSEHVWHGVFRADGQLLPPDYNSVASDFALSQIFPQVIGSPEYNTLNELRIPVNDLMTTLPRAIVQDRYAQAEFVARDAQQKARECRSQGSPRYEHERNGLA